MRGLPFFRMFLEKNNFSVVCLIIGIKNVARVPWGVCCEWVCRCAASLLLGELAWLLCVDTRHTPLFPCSCRLLPTTNEPAHLRAAPCHFLLSQSVCVPLAASGGDEELQWMWGPTSEGEVEGCVIDGGVCIIIIK